MTTDNATSRWEQQPDGSFVPERIFSYRDTPRDNGGWVKPTLGANIADFGSPFGGVRVRKDSLGFVHMKGLTQIGAALTTLYVQFTLPVGYRPGITHLTSCWAQSGGVEKQIRMDLQADGLVYSTATFANLDWVSFNGITYLAEG
jgi:hypothetical protein